MMASDGASIYWLNQGTAANSRKDGQVMKAPVTGATCAAAEELASAQHRPADLALDAGSLYWIVDPSTTSTADGKVMTCAAAGCSKTPTEIASGLLRPTLLTALAGTVYWTSDSTYATSDDCNTDRAIFLCASCRGGRASIPSYRVCLG